MSQSNQNPAPLHDYVGFTGSTEETMQQGQCDSLDFLEALGSVSEEESAEGVAGILGLNEPFLQLPAYRMTVPIPAYQTQQETSSNKLDYFESILPTVTSQKETVGRTSSSTHRTYRELIQPTGFHPPPPPPQPQVLQLLSSPPVYPLSVPNVIQLSPNLESTRMVSLPSHSRSKTHALEKIPPETSFPSQVTADCGSPQESPTGSKATKMKSCHVCGDVAKSCHFGGISCDSCKAFFRRAVFNDSHMGFRCVQQHGLCQINVSTRKMCQFCRFNKCIKIGMEKKWVMSDEQRNAFQKQRKEKKQQKQESKSKSNPSAREISGDSRAAAEDDSVPPTDFTYKPDRSQKLSYMSAEVEREIDMLVLQFQQGYIEIPYMVSNREDRSSVEIIDMFTTILRRLVYFYKNLSDFTDLSLQDQSTLLRQGILEMCMLRSALTYDTENGHWPVQTEGTEFHQNCPILRVEDMAKLVSTDLYDMQMKFIEGIQRLEADEHIVTLLSLVVLFYPDRSGLEDIAAVSTIQDRYLQHLQKYVLWRYGPNGSRMYAKLLTKLSDLRQLNDTHNQYNLRLAQQEIAIIQEQLGDINLNPYTTWNIVQCEEDKEVGSVEPTRRWPGRSFSGHSSTNPSDTAHKRKGKTSLSTSDSSSTPTSTSTSTSSTSSTSTATSQHFRPMDNNRYLQSPYAGVMFSHIVNRQIPILVKDPTATISSEQELTHVSSLFASSGPKLAKMAQLDQQVGFSLPQYNIRSDCNQLSTCIMNTATSCGLYPPPPQQLSQLLDANLSLDEPKEEVIREALESLGGETENLPLMNKIKSSLSPQILTQLQRVFGPNIAQTLPLHYQPSDVSSSVPRPPIQNPQQGNYATHYYNREWEEKQDRHVDTQLQYSIPSDPTILGGIQDVLPSIRYHGLEPILEAVSSQQSSLPFHYSHSQNSHIPQYPSHSHSYPISTPSVSNHDNPNMIPSNNCQYYNNIPGTAGQLSLRENNYERILNSQVTGVYPHVAPVQPTSFGNAEYASTSHANTRSRSRKMDINNHFGQRADAKGQRKDHRQ